MSKKLVLRPLWVGYVDDPDEPDGPDVYHSGWIRCEKCKKSGPEDLMVYGSLRWGQPINHYHKTCVSRSFVSYDDYQEAADTQGL